MNRKHLGIAALAVSLSAPMAFAQAAPGTQEGATPDVSIHQEPDANATQTLQGGAAMNTDTNLQTMPVDDDGTTSTHLLSSDVIGATIYTAVTEAPATTDMGTTTAPATGTTTATTDDTVDVDWESIAEIDDIVLNQDGSLAGYVLDVGGFLGMGSKSVLIAPDSLSNAEMDGEVVLVSSMTREELEALPEFEHN